MPNAVIKYMYSFLKYRPGGKKKTPVDGL